MEILLFLISHKKKRTLKSSDLFDTFEDIAHAISAFDLAWGERSLKLLATSVDSWWNWFKSGCVCFV